MIETYKKMWRFMESKKPTVFTSTYEEGIRRVLDGNYGEQKKNRLFYIYHYFI